MQNNLTSYGCAYFYFFSDKKVIKKVFDDFWKSIILFSNFFLQF